MKPVKFAKEIVGERVVLKEHSITFEHAKAAFEIIDRNRDIFEKYLTWAKTTKTPEDVFKGFLLSIEGKIDSGERAEYMIILDNKFIGQIGFFNIDIENESGEIGYWLDKDYTGKGYMHEAVAILEKYIFELGFNRISIKHSSHNQASKNVIEKSNYILEGISRKVDIIDGEWRDDYIYSKLKSEFQG